MSGLLGHRGLLLGGVAPPPVTYTTLNPSDKAASVSLSGGNLIATATSNPSGVARSVQVLSGKRYFEAVLTSTGGAVGAVYAAGVCNSAQSLTGSMGYATANGWAGWGPSGGWRHNGVPGTGTLTNADVLGFAIDTATNSLWVRDNGVWATGDPVAGTGAMWTNLTGTLYAAACPWSLDTIVTMRFDPATFRDAAPSGFSPITA